MNGSGRTDKQVPREGGHEVEHTAEHSVAEPSLDLLLFFHLTPISSLLTELCHLLATWSSVGGRGGEREGEGEGEGDGYVSMRGREGIHVCKRGEGGGECNGCRRGCLSV